MVPLPPARRPCPSLAGRTLAGLFLAAAAVLAAPAVLATEDAEMAATFDRFTRLGLDTSRSVPVNNLKIERDGMVLELKSGRLWLAKPLRDRITGAHFIGSGVVTITSNGLSGLNMLRATLKGQNAGVPMPGKMPADAILRPASGEKDFDVFQAKVTEVYLRFSDGLEEMLTPLLEDGGGAESADAEKSFASRNDKLFYFSEHGVAPQIAFLLQVENGLDSLPFFYAEFAIGPEWLTYMNQAMEPQEIWIGTHPSIGVGVTQRDFTWTTYHQDDDYDPKGHWDADLLVDQKILVDVTHVEMAIDIPTTQAFTIDAKVTFMPLANELSVVNFDLINNYGYGWWEKGGRPVTLKSVTTTDGVSIPFIHKADTVLVRLLDPLPQGEPVTLRFQADEQTIIQVEGALPEDDGQAWQVVSSYPWYPSHGYLAGLFTIDWVVKVKSPLTAVASGQLVEVEEQSGLQVTHWVSDRELNLPGFIFGRFDSREDDYQRQVGEGKVVVAAHAHPRGRFRGVAKLKDVNEEAKTILEFYEKLLTPYPYQRLDITQMAVFEDFGEAPPGILFLTGDAFLPTGLAIEAANSLGRMKAPYYHDFFAHELGHQWWGNKVVWGSDEDVWLSESFTEYFSALYALQIDGMGKFQEKLKNWHDQAKIGERSGLPLVASRWVTATDPVVESEYRSGLLYNKGPYVVHMLRMTIGHEKFIEAMKTFLERYDGRMATTAMLKEVVEEITSGSMDWFFDQWFYTAGIPTFRFSYDTAKTEDGSYLLTGRIVQDPENYKQVLMPVFYELGGKQPSIQNVAVGTADFTFKAKLPVEPKKVWLDEYNTVLGDKILEKK